MRKFYFWLSITIAGMFGALTGASWAILFPGSPQWPSWILAFIAGFGIGRIYKLLEERL